MTTFSAIANSQIDPDSPVTTGLMTQLRDNPVAIGEFDSTIPAVPFANRRIGIESLGIFSGRAPLTNTGTPTALTFGPVGFTFTRVTSVWTITHNLGLAPDSYTVFAICITSSNVFVRVRNINANSFQILIDIEAGPVNFLMIGVPV